MNHLGRGVARTPLRNPFGPVTGVFDPCLKTFKGVPAVQRLTRTPGGIVGPATWAKTAGLPRRLANLAARQQALGSADVAVLFPASTGEPSIAFLASVGSVGD